MAKFDLKKMYGVKGKQTFYQLTIDDVPDYEGAENEEERNNRKTGVLDLYEAKLEKRYIKDIDMIYAYMNMVANNDHIPGTKYHPLERDKNDPYPDFEFKHGDLRVYGVKVEGGKVIFLGGYKNDEKRNIRALRALKQQYFKS